MKKINRDIIKYIAIVLMAIDHIIQALPVVDGYTYKLLDGLSHFTYLSMAFFLIESYKYTHSKKDYVKKMLIFAAIAQVPYSLTFTGTLGLIPLNILFTLAFNFILIYLLDTTEKMYLKILYGIFAIAIGFFCDWMFMAPIIVMLFWWAKDSKIMQWIAYLIAMIMIILVANSNYFLADTGEMSFAILFASAWGVALSAIFTLCLYNGKQMKGMKKFNKWFFYIFYPAHLIVIGIIKFTCF